MNKLTKQFFAVFSFIATVGLMSSCSKTSESPQATLPPATGDVQISFLNYPGTGDVSITAAPGNFISVAVSVQKSPKGDRPQKLRVYEADSINTRGSQIGGSPIDLRNTDKQQIKNVNYTFPVSATKTKYLYFEVDESGGNFSRKLLIINPSSSATLNTYSGIVLGAQTNAAASRLSSATGQLYVACDVYSNVNDIDITYLSNGSTPTPTFSSNPQRAVLGQSTDATGCEDSNSSHSTAGGPGTIFSSVKVANLSDFTNASDATLAAYDITGTQQSITVSAGDIIAFKRADGKKGFIKVNSIPDTGVSGTINIDVKVQR